MSKYAITFCIILFCTMFSITLHPVKSDAATNPENSPFENLGPKVEYLNVIKGKLVSLQDQDYYVALLQGEPAKVAIIDYETKKVVDLKELEGATAAWAIESSPDGIVWIGTNPNAHIYKYDLKTKQLTDVGKATNKAKDTAIWDLTYDSKNKRLFGVTAYTGSLFSYSEISGFRDFGTVMIGKQNARSVVYDDTENTVYIGVGSPAALIKWNLDTYEQTNLLEDYDKQSGSVYDLDLVDGQLFAKMEGTNEILHYDIKTGELVHTFKANSRGVSQKIPNETAVFYSDGGVLYEYNYVTNSSRQINSNLYGSAAVSLDILPSKNEVIGLAGNLGRFYDYDYEKNQFSATMLDLPPQFVGIYKIGVSSTGDIYSSGFISGYLSKFNLSTSSNEIFNKIGQIEGFTEQNDKMYFGTYPEADIYEYDPKNKWSVGTNPRKLFSLADVGQSRPSVMVSDEKNHRLFIGTVPKRGERSGLLTVYDTEKQEEIEHIELKEGQSVVSATYDEENNILYAGTSVYDGTGKKTDDSARIFKINLNESPYVIEEITISKGYNEMVSALNWNKDGKVFGIVDNKFFVYYLEDEKIDIYPIMSDSVSGTGKNESLIDGQDGYLYGTVQRNLFRVNIASLDIKMFRRGDVETLVRDPEGYLYFNSGANLWRIHSWKLTDSIAINPDQIQIPHVTVTESPFPIARVYIKNPVFLYKKIDGRMVPYETVSAKQALRVYGIEGQYYHTGGGYYIYHEGSKMSAYIGRVFSSEPVPILKPDGNVFRYMEPGEEIKVYDYNEEKYDVGAGYTIAKGVAVTYYTGSVTLKENTLLYKHGEEESVLELEAGEQYFITKTDGDKLDIGDGYYILYDKDTLTYSKS